MVSAQDSRAHRITTSPYERLKESEVIKWSICRGSCITGELIATAPPPLPKQNRMRLRRRGGQWPNTCKG